MKRVFILILSLLIALAAAGCVSSPGEELFSFEEREDGYVIASVGAIASKVVLPAEHLGRPVVAVKESAFYRSTMLRSLTVPASIKEIGAYAFGDCTALLTVTFLEGGACAVGDHAFDGCTALRYFRANGSVTSLGEGALKNCRKLSSFRAGKELTTIGEDAFMNCERLIVKAPADSALAEYAEARALPTNFFSSIYASYLPVAAGVLLGAAALIVFGVVSKKKKTKKADAAKEKG